MKVNILKLEIEKKGESISEANVRIIYEIEEIKKEIFFCDYSFRTGMVDMCENGNFKKFLNSYNISKRKLILYIIKYIRNNKKELMTKIIDIEKEIKECNFEVLESKINENEFKLKAVMGKNIVEIEIKEYIGTLSYMKYNFENDDSIEVVVERFFRVYEHIFEDKIYEFENIRLKKLLGNELERTIGRYTKESINKITKKQ